MNRIVIVLLWLCCWACKDSSKQEVTFYLECDVGRVVCDNTAQVKEIRCSTNLENVQVIFEPENEKWCQGHFDTENSKLVFEVQENKVPQSREVSIRMGEGGVQQKIVVFQAGTEPVLLLNPDTLRVNAGKSLAQVEVSTNVEFEAEVVKGKEWITLMAQDEKIAWVQKLKIDGNRLASLRVGSIRFKQKDGNLEKVLTVIQQGNKYTAEMKVPFGNMGFIEPLENATYAKKTIQGIREWKNGETVIKFFVNVASQPLPEDSLFMELKGHAYEDARLEVKINGNKVGTLNVNTGDFILALPAFVPFSSNYQCISFQGLDGNKHYPDLDTMVIHYRPELKLNYNTSHYGAPAVHLNYSQVDGKNIEWSLGEIMVKPEACRPDMYYMVSGFNGGYSGIQVSADFDLADPRGNTFLFSVWSDFDTQHPSDIPDDYQPWTDEIRKGNDMRDEGFGNEGSGVHANWFYKWKPDVIYKFLIRQEDVGTVRRNGKDYPNCKAYTCWVYVPEEGGWIFFVRYIRPNDTRGSLGVPGSFVENPSGTHSSSKYRGYYRHWLRYRGSSEWVALKHANFGTTGANDKHPRYDVGIGKENIRDENQYGGEFCYIFSGGFTVNNGKAGLKEELSFTEVPDIDLAHLPALEKFDNMMEGDTPEGVEEIDRTEWTSTASSEEQGGPYEDGFARFTIDGNTATFWHTRYTGETPDYPHWIQIDMKKTEIFNGFSIQPRGKDVTKEFRAEISTDGADWTALGQFTLSNNGNIQKFTLPEAKSARYLKITCLNGYGTAKYTSIKEIGVFKNK